MSCVGVVELRDNPCPWDTHIQHIPSITQVQVSFFFLYVPVKYLNIIIGYIERIIDVLLYRVEISEIKCQAEESVEKSSTTAHSIGSPAGIKLCSDSIWQSQHV